jgi:very-short-patch-repair endonuclease
MLADYLVELAKLGTRTITDLDKYENVIWLKEGDYRENIWLEVKRPRIVVTEKNDLLEIHNRENGDLLITDEIRENNDEEYKRQREIYSHLFHIHQEQLKSGEEYELVLGIGLLQRKRQNENKENRIRRHLVVFNAELEFDGNTGKFTVREHESGANSRFERDICGIAGININDLPELEDNPWSNEIENVLQQLVNSIDENGEYERHYHPVPNMTENAAIFHAPALIFRKRSTLRIIDVLEKIKVRIKNNEQSELFSLISGDQPACSVEDVSVGSTNAAETEIFFPKPSNDEQYEIVKKMRRSDGVIVQGPPGTGKSHTVANLICHLLACGKKILVTAQTQKALQVLDKLIPEDLRPLCVSMLGTGAEEKKSLETSVNRILQKQAPSQEEINNLAKRLDELRREQSEKVTRLRAIRESETHPQTIAEGRYKGKAAEIAQILEQESADYGWFTDTIPLDGNCPFKPESLRHLISSLAYFTPEKRAEIAFSVPADLPPPDDFTQWVEKEQAAAREEAKWKEQANEKLIDIFSRQPDAIDNLLNRLEAFDRARARLPINKPWMIDAAREIMAGDHSSWNVVLNKTEQIISSIQDIVEQADQTSISIPEDREIRVLRNDAGKLKEHIENKGGLGWWPFQAEVVKERFYLVKYAKIDGRRCLSLDDFTRLYNRLHVQAELEEAQGLWSGKLELARPPYSLCFSRLKDARDSIKKILAIRQYIADCQSAMNNFPSAPVPDWNAGTGGFTASCRLVAAHVKRLEFAGKIRQIEPRIDQAISTGNPHPQISSLRDTILKRDPVGYRKNEAIFRNLEQDKQKLSKLNEYYQKLETHFPNLARDIKDTCNSHVWEKRIREIDKAWHWRQARNWIDDYVRKEDAQAIAERIKQLEAEIGQTVARLAACRAWRFCLARFDKTTRQHMEGWQLAMKRLGKGTGKFAAVHRKNAQQHLNYCRGAVPAYVMPLYRVWDTVDPLPGIFDVVIVDEASQCRFDAIPLFYLAKKILIVGDDKQISPDATFIKGNQVQALIQKYLGTHEFKDTFVPEISLFDHGKLLFGAHGNKVVLREHFRCMPEIIRFSNDNFYRTSEAPLIPLRQYSPDRLPPLLHFYVEDGYCQGENSNIINLPEAEAITKKIVECCKDEAYAGKTMGVVVLQGEKQASVIENLLLQYLGAEEMEKRRLICGNAYGFQGDERDIMFLSLVVANNHNFTSLTADGYEKRFNVAASRARDQMVLFHSVRVDDLGANCLRKKLLEFFMNTTPQQIAGIDLNNLENLARGNRTVVRPPQPFDSWFEVDVALEICRRGYTAIPQYEVAGRRIDLVIEGGAARLAVECDGDHWHGPDAYDADMARERQLVRCGWEFFRVRGAAFYADRQTSLEKLWPMLETRGILPGR